MSIFRNHFPLMGAAGQSTGYEINQSIRFDQDNNASLQRTPSSAGNRRNWTFSVWFKQSLYSTNGYHNIFCVSNDSNNFYEMAIRRNSTFASDGTGHNLQINNKVGGTNNYFHKTDMAFTDPTAWYHLVAVADTPNQIPNERMRLYVNGVRITSFETNTIPAEDYETWVNSTNNTMIGNFPGGSGYAFDGYMAEIHLVDGYSYGPEYFGEFKEDTDIWIPKKYTGSHGTNGFYITGENINVPGENKATGNTYASFANTAYQTHDQTLDSPTNNFAVFNPLLLNTSAQIARNATFKNGMLQLDNTTTTADFCGTTIFGPNAFKGYAEFYVTHSGSGIFGSSADNRIMILDDEAMINSTTWYSIYYSNGNIATSGESTLNETAWAKGDVIGVAVDMANNIKWYRNGTLEGTADVGGSYQSLGYMFNIRIKQDSSKNPTIIANFGQEGTFAGNITAGGNSDGNGIGNFKYSVPSGYLAMCTKNVGV